MSYEITDDRVTKTEHHSYDEFERSGFVVTIPKGNKIKIQILDSKDVVLKEKIFIAKYEKSHINCQWQDKGVKKIEELM